MNSTTKQQHSEESLESSLRAIFAEARACEKAHDNLEAERHYHRAIEFASGNFGNASYHLASAYFHCCAFYARLEKFESARQFYDQMRQIMRY